MCMLKISLLTANDEAALFLSSSIPLLLSHLTPRKEAGLLFFIPAKHFDPIFNDLTIMVDGLFTLKLIVVLGRIASCVRRRVRVEIALMVMTY